MERPSWTSTFRGISNLRLGHESMRTIILAIAISLTFPIVSFGTVLWSTGFESFEIGSSVSLDEFNGHAMYDGENLDDMELMCVERQANDKCLMIDTTDAVWFTPLVGEGTSIGGYVTPAPGQKIIAMADVKFTSCDSIPSTYEEITMPDVLTPETGRGLVAERGFFGTGFVVIQAGTVFQLDDKLTLSFVETESDFESEGQTNWIVQVGVENEFGVVEARTLPLCAANQDERIPLTKEDFVNVRICAVNDSSANGLGLEIYLNGIKAAGAGTSIFRPLPASTNRTGLAGMSFNGNAHVDNILFEEKVEVAIRNVAAKQRYPWNGLVDITCEVSGIDGTTNGLYFAVSAVNSGATNNVSHLWVVQDGARTADYAVRTNGNYRLLWDAQADLGAVIYSNMIVRVNIKEHKKVQLWENGPYWADTNIGAVEPWESGYYFWWGDVVGYKWENDVWVATDGSSSNLEFSVGQFCRQTYTNNIDQLLSGGWVVPKDGTYVLAPEHDAAQVQWGDGWRMPTDQEMSDLINCDWTWTTKNGVSGYEVRGRGGYIANSIFLPAAGYAYHALLDRFGSHGYYWSSVPERAYSSSSCYSWMIYFVAVDDGPYSGHIRLYDYDRCHGQSIRPVQGLSE